MPREIPFSDLRKVLGEVEYPTPRVTAAEEFADVTLLLADGDVNLGELVSATGSESFDSVDDLESELHNTLPRRAVGEPYQSEGEG